MMVRLGLIVMAVTLFAEAAAACTILTPSPAAGETLEESVWRREAAYQRHLRQTVSHIYVARIVRTGRNFRFEPLTVLKGPRPPRWVFVPSHGTCGFDPEAGQIRLVFAEHMDGEEFPGQPWNWGRMAVLHSVRLDQIADPDLAALRTPGAGR